MRLAAWKVVLGLGAVAAGVYFLVPGSTAKNLVYLAIGLASTVLVLWAIRTRRPVERLGWYLLAAANACFMLGDGIWNVYDLLNSVPPLPSWADVLYLAGYPFLFAGVFRVSRSRRIAGFREARVDAAMVCIGATALLWQLIIGSYAHDETLSGLGKLVTMAYPVMDLGVVFILVNSMMAGTGRRAAEKLLWIAMLLIAVGDLAYDILVANSGYTAGDPVDATFMLSYVFIAAAAWHPSVAEPSPEIKDSRGGRSWLVLVATAGVVSPVILISGSLFGFRVDVAVLAATSIALVGLTLLRTDWLLHRLRERTSELEQRGESLSRSLATQQALEADLRHQAFHDSLSGLPNRSLLHDRVQHALEASPRLRGMVALLFCDLDGFKSVNDSLGHQFGDELLTVVGKRLASVVRPGDTVARLGGDEFAILLEDIDSVDAVTAIADRIVAVLRQPAVVSGRQIHLTTSVGVAFAGAGSTTESLLSEADAAMYEAKAHGKDRYAIFESFMRAQAIERMTVMNAFQGSLERGEFFLEYQPQHALADGALEGFEALVRWQHPSLGRLMPDRFIPLAEETGFIIPMGRWILEQACLEAADWTSSEGRPISLSVNLSGRQLQDPRVVQDVLTALSFSGLSPQRLILEITETVLVTEPGAAAQVLQQFKMMGIRIAIDDFGSGYSSLSYLRQFPVDILKIDKSFIDPLQDPASEGAAFVQTMLVLAHDLRLDVIAEGIEQEIQRAALVRMQCHGAQGNLLSMPLGAEAARTYMAAAGPLRRQLEVARSVGHR